MNNTTATKVRVQCNCKTCKTNAARIGRAAPLAALAPAAFAQVATPHVIVYMAHNPNAVDRAASARVGVQAI